MLLDLVTPVALADAYGIPGVVDYGPHRAGSGLLVTTGAGMLMADMDVRPDCRWAVDLGAGRHNPAAADWVEACSWICTHLVAHVWMSLTSPDWMADVLGRFPRARVACYAYPPLDVGTTLHSLAELEAWPAP